MVIEIFHGDELVGTLGWNTTASGFDGGRIGEADTSTDDSGEVAIWHQENNNDASWSSSFAFESGSFEFEYHYDADNNQIVTMQRVRDTPSAYYWTMDSYVEINENDSYAYCKADYENGWSIHDFFANNEDTHSGDVWMHNDREDINYSFDTNFAHGEIEDGYWIGGASVRT